MNATKQSTMELAQKFAAKCKAEGWTWEARESVVTVSTRFAPGDNNAYVKADNVGYELLAMVPLKGGSVWGTDGGSIGGHVGLKGGYYRLNKSGTGGKRFVQALEKIGR